MHRDHELLLAEIKKNARSGYRALEANDSYTGSKHTFYNVSVPVRRKIAKTWLAANKTSSSSQLLAVASSLFSGASHEEKTIAAIMLGYAPALRAGVTPRHIDRWLGELNGWAEVDSLCANVFKVEEMFSAWPQWKALIRQLSRNKDINKRRAALVLLTGPVRYSDDTRLTQLAFETIDTLKAARDILITKAVSWLLRSMAPRHKSNIAAYLAANEESLPKIALRETRMKLRTGTKSGQTKRKAD